MKQKLRQLIRYLVGYEVGYVGTGCHQWYYTVYVAISIMFAWRNYPNIAPYYTAVSVVEYIGVCIYGIFSSPDHSFTGSILYLLFVVATGLVRFIVCWELALIMIVVGAIGVLIAPDESGQSYIFHFPEEQSWRALIPNAIYFGMFAYSAIILPVDVGTKVIIILGAMALHPLIDIADGACISYFDNIMDCIFTLIDLNDERKDRKYQKQKTTNDNNTP